MIIFAGMTLIEKVEEEEEEGGRKLKKVTKMGRQSLHQFDHLDVELHSSISTLSLHSKDRFLNQAV